MHISAVIATLSYEVCFRSRNHGVKLLWSAGGFGVANPWWKKEARTWWLFMIFEYIWYAYIVYINKYIYIHWFWYWFVYVVCFMHIGLYASPSTRYMNECNIGSYKLFISCCPRWLAFSGFFTPLEVEWSKAITVTRGAHQEARRTFRCVAGQSDFYKMRRKQLRQSRQFGEVHCERCNMCYLHVDNWNIFLKHIQSICQISCHFL